MPRDSWANVGLGGEGGSAGGKSRPQVLDCKSCRRSQLRFLMAIPGRSPGVTKIFRFHLEHTDPCLYFRRESTSYSLLCCAGLLGTVVPAVHGVLRTRPPHEAALVAEGKLGGLQTMQYRARPATAQLMAVWVEFILGGRLSCNDVGLSVRAEGVTCGLGRIHDAGVLQGDVKWRNIMVADDADRGVVWIDFSTSDAPDDGPTDRSWQEKVQVEKNKLEDMLGGYRQVRTKFFLVFSLSHDPVDRKSASGRCTVLKGNVAKIWRPRKYNKAPLPLSTLPRMVPRHITRRRVRLCWLSTVYTRHALFYVKARASVYVVLFSKDGSLPARYIGELSQVYIY